MRTGASHGTGKERTCSLLCYLLLLMLPAAMAVAACSDDGHPGSDADIDGDASRDGGLPGLDAYVDNGPLDCGVQPPIPDSVCVTGRLYDWMTEQPIPAHHEQQIVSFDGYDNYYLDVKHSPTSYKGRVDPNGRFFAWTNDTSDHCLSLYEPVPGYKTDTINCYSYRPPDISFRYYLVRQEVFDTWVVVYPGAGDFTMDRPLFVGTCRNLDWTRSDAPGWLWWPRPWDPGITAEAFALTDDRLGFVLPTVEPWPPYPSASYSYWARLEFEGAPVDEMSRFDFDCFDYSSSWTGFKLTREMVDSGEIDLMLVSNVDW